MPTGEPDPVAPGQVELLDPTAIVLQPIVAIPAGTVVAAEALARLPQRPGWPVDALFTFAHAAGWGTTSRRHACAPRSAGEATCRRESPSP